MSGEIDRPSTQTTAATGQCNEFELVAVDNTVESSAVHNSGDVQCDLWEFGDYPVVASCDEKGPRVNSVISQHAELKISPLQSVGVLVEGRRFTALSDSGCQIHILNHGVIAMTESCKLGKVKLRGVIGNAVSVPLVSVNVKLAGDDQCERVMESLQLTCPIADLNADGYDVILPQDIVSDL